MPGVGARRLCRCARGSACPALRSSRALRRCGRLPGHGSAPAPRARLGHGSTRSGALGVRADAAACAHPAGGCWVRTERRAARVPASPHRQRRCLLLKVGLTFLTGLRCGSAAGPSPIREIIGELGCSSFARGERYLGCCVHRT